MSQKNPIFLVSISIADILSQDQGLLLQEFDCYIFLNNDPVFKIALADKESIAVIPITNLDNKIEFIFKKADKSEIFGCVSIISRLFLPFLGQKLTQWITLFDSPDDDDFDGQLGLSDEECPKVLINFNIDPVNNSSELTVESASFNVKQLSLQEKQQRKNEIINNSSDEKAYKGNNLNSNDLNLANTENMMKSNFQQSYSIYYESNKDKSSNVLSTRTLNDSNVLLSGSLRRKSIGEDLPYSEIDIKKIISQYEDKISTINAELQKNKDLESENIKLRTLLDESNKKYEDSQQKIKLQFKQLFDRSRELNDENYTLKQKLADFENKQLSVEGHNPKENEYTKLTIERYNLKIQNLEKLIKDLKEQNNINEKAYKSELEKNKKVVDAQTDLLVNYKKIIDNSNSLQANFEDKIKRLDEEKLVIETTLKTRTNELEQLSLRSMSLEMNVMSLQDANMHLLKELDDQKRHNSALRDSINNLLKEKENEILGLRDGLHKANNKINEIYSEYVRLQRDKDYIQNEYNQITSRNYENEILQLEENLEVSEKSRKFLQNEIDEAHKRWDTIIKDIERTFLSNPDQDFISNLEKKNKQALDQLQIQTKECDRLKFENMNLQIKINELLQLCEEHEELKLNYQTLRRGNVEIQPFLGKNDHEFIKQFNSIYGNNEMRMQLHGEEAAALSNTNDIPFEPYTPKKNDEIDMLLGEYINKNRIPVRFNRIAEGIYNFGSKKVNIKLVNNRLAATISRGFILIEDFIKLFLSQELAKQRMILKGIPIPITEFDVDDTSPETKMQIFRDDDKEIFIIHNEIELSKQQYDNKAITTNTNESSTSSLNIKISPTRTSLIKSSPLGRNCHTTERVSYNSNQKSDIDKGLLMTKNLLSGNKTQMNELENTNDESPKSGSKKKSRKSERYQGFLNNHNQSTSTVMTKSPMKEKDRIGSKGSNNNTTRKEITPLIKKYTSIK